VRAPELFAGGVDVHGVHDWNVVIRNFVSTYDPLAQREEARLALASSPMASLRGWRAPVLLVHGDDDRNVPFSETVDLAAALRRQGVEVELLVLPDEVHSFLLHSSWRRVFEAASEFLDRRLARR
jgi:dipeptidyl aminopeptidase/acylaminoacyl peptidase